MGRSALCGRKDLLLTVETDNILFYLINGLKYIWENTERFWVESFNLYCFDFIFLAFSLLFNFVPFFSLLLIRRGYQTLLLGGPLPLILLGLVRNITPPSSELLESQIWDATEHMMQSNPILLSGSDALLCSTPWLKCGQEKTVGLYRIIRYWDMRRAIKFN